MRRDEKLVFVSTDGSEVIFAVNQALTPYWLDNATGLDGLTVNLYTYKGAGQDGETLAGKNLKARAITLDGQIVDDSPMARRNLIKSLSPKASGKLIYEDDTGVWYIPCEVKTAPVIDRSSMPNFQIEFLCPNPFWRAGSGAKQVADIALWMPALEFPVDIPEEGMDLEYRSPSLIVNVANTGDVEVGMLVEFRATGTTANPYIINVGTQKQLIVNRDMDAGDVIRVWTGYGEKRAELTRAGMTSNIINDIPVDAEFLQLAIGDNLFRYGADIIDNLEVSIYYDIAYVGV